MADPVLLEHFTDGVLHLVLNRPDRRNALSAELRTRLVERLAGAEADDTVGAVLLSGAGGCFCAGFDLKEIEAADDPAAVFADSAAYHRAVHGFTKPLIAAVAGPAVAGGFDLALMCDLRIAATDAVFGQTQVRHGIPASYELVAGVIGDHPARDLCLTGRLVAAVEAHRLGIVQRVTEVGDLLDEAHSLAVDIASLPASTAMKAQFLASQPAPFDG